MSKWKDLFEESPPPQHLNKILKAADPFLADSQRKYRRAFLIKWLVGGLATGVAGLTGILLFQNRQNENLQMAQFIDIEEQDVAFVADQEFDFEFLENLEMLVAEEDV